MNGNSFLLFFFYHFNYFLGTFVSSPLCFKKLAGKMTSNAALGEEYKIVRKALVKSIGNQKAAPFTEAQMVGKTTIEFTL